MAKTLKSIEAAIRRKRESLNKAGARYGVHSHYVLKMSQELDNLINEYITIKMKNRKK